MRSRCSSTRRLPRPNASIRARAPVAYSPNFRSLARYRIPIASGPRLRKFALRSSPRKPVERFLHMSYWRSTDARFRHYYRYTAGGED